MISINIVFLLRSNLVLLDLRLFLNIFILDCAAVRYCLCYTILSKRFCRNIKKGCCRESAALERSIYIYPSLEALVERETFKNAWVKCVNFVVTLNITTVLSYTHKKHHNHVVIFLNKMLAANKMFYDGCLFAGFGFMWNHYFGFFFL